MSKQFWWKKWIVSVPVLLTRAALGWVISPVIMPCGEMEVIRGRQWESAREENRENTGIRKGLLLVLLSLSFFLVFHNNSPCLCVSAGSTYPISVDLSNTDTGHFSFPGWLCLRQSTGVPKTGSLNSACLWHTELGMKCGIEPGGYTPDEGCRRHHGGGWTSDMAALSRWSHHVCHLGCLGKNCLVGVSSAWQGLSDLETIPLPLFICNEHSNNNWSNVCSLDALLR